MNGTKVYAFSALLFIYFSVYFELAQCSSFPPGSGSGHHGSDDKFDSLTEPLLAKQIPSRSGSHSPQAQSHRSPSPPSTSRPAISKGERIKSTITSHHESFNSERNRKLQIYQYRQRARARQSDFRQRRKSDDESESSLNRNRSFGNDYRTTKHLSGWQHTGYKPPTLREVGVESSTTQSPQHAAAPSSPTHVTGKNDK